VVAYTKEKFLKFELGLYSDGATMLKLARAISDLVTRSYDSCFQVVCKGSGLTQLLASSAAVTDSTTYAKSPCVENVNGVILQHALATREQRPS